MAEQVGTGGGGQGGGTTKSGIETPRTPAKSVPAVETKIYPGSHSIGQGARNFDLEGPRDGKKGPGGA